MFWSSTQSLNSSSCEVDSLKSTAKSHDVEGISAIGDLLKSQQTTTAKNLLSASSQRRILRIGERCRSVLPCADRLEISVPGEKQKSLQVRMSYRRYGSPSG